MKIGFIGTGVMGHSIVKHLLRKHKVVVYTRTKEKAVSLFELGVSWSNSPKELAEQSDIVMTMVGFPHDVEAVYFGSDGIFQSDIKGKTLIDLTTSTPSLAKIIAKKALEKGANSLDCPVSGGDIGAQKGMLTTMVGGKKEVFDVVEPLLRLFSKTVVLQGDAGSGQHTKMANQIMIAGTMTGLTELLVYAKNAQLDLARVIETVSTGSAANWSLTNYAPRILSGDFSPGFFAKHFLKDLKIALDEAEAMGIVLPATQRAKDLYTLLVDMDLGDQGTQALIHVYEQNAQQLHSTFLR